MGSGEGGKGGTIMEASCIKPLDRIILRCRESHNSAQQGTTVAPCHLGNGSSEGTMVLLASYSNELHLEINSDPR